MENKRAIKFITLYNILKGKKPFFTIGIIFTFLSVFILLPAIIAISNTVKTPYEAYDSKSIENNGTALSANVVGVELLNNVQVNNEHPSIISYNYTLDGQQYADKFKTILHNSGASLKPNDTITIKAYNHQSIIVGLQPFTFPYFVFYIFPFIFFTVGVPFLLIGLIPGLKRLKLYQYGVAKQAIIVGMTPDYPKGKNKYPPFVAVNYYFISTTGQKIMGNSFTHDMTILYNKKLGDHINIFVSADDEQKSCVIEMKEAERNGWAL